jgi:hypothetical protein
MRIKTIVTFLVLNVLLVLFALPCFAAVPYTVNIQMKPMSVHSNDFYIQKVIDGRMNKSSIGFVQTGVSNNQVPAYLAGNLADVFQSFLNLSFPVDNTKIPIIVVFDQLSVSEKEGPSGEYAMAEVKMKFFKAADNKVGKVFETEAFSENRSLWDVTKYHDANIRKAIEKCFTEFISSNWKTADVNWEEQGNFESALLNKQKAQLTKIEIIRIPHGMQVVYQGHLLTLDELDDQLSKIPETLPEIAKAKSYISSIHTLALGGYTIIGFNVGEAIGGKGVTWQLSIWGLSSILLANHLGKLMVEHYEKAIEIYNAGI